MQRDDDTQQTRNTILARSLVQSAKNL